MDKLKEKIEKLLLSTNRDNCAELIKKLNSIGFFYAPASSSYHLSCEGGLATHSLNVCKAAIKIYENIVVSEKISEEEKREQINSIIIASLLHDVCKCDGYVFDAKKNKYIKNPDSIPFGHGEKSVINLLRWGFKLTDAEIAAIRWHMGAWCLDRNSLMEMGDYNSAKKKYPLVTIIEAADFISSNILESDGDNN